MKITSLVPGKTYYFAIKAIDDAGNQSGLSNSPSATVNSPTPVGAGIHDNISESIVYSGNWQPNVGAVGPYDGTMHYTTQQGAKASLTFTGTSVSLIYTKHTNRGNILISIDGGPPVTVNAYNKTTVWQSRWNSPQLSPGVHTIVIEHPVGTHFIDVDGFEVRD
jgi:hypothetical protein